MLTLCIVCLDYVTVISQSNHLLPSHCPWCTLVIISCTHCEFSHSLLRSGHCLKLCSGYYVFNYSLLLVCV